MACEIGSSSDCPALTDDQGTHARFCYASPGFTECRNVCHGVAADSARGGAVGAACSYDNNCDQTNGLTCDNDTVGSSTCTCVAACVPELNIQGTYNGKFTCKNAAGDCITLDPSTDTLSAESQYPAPTASFTITDSLDPSDEGDRFSGRMCGDTFSWEETTAGEEREETGQWTFVNSDSWTKNSTGYGPTGAVIFKCTGTGARAPATPPDPLTCAEYHPTF